VPPPDAAYDPKLHQLLEGETALDGAVVATTLAQGYTFQGQVVRLPLVTVSNHGPAKKTDEPEAQLSFEDRS
jgi:molecular chaperone GrpE (heat shock protein)